MIEVNISDKQLEEAKQLANIDKAYGSEGYLENQNKTGKRAGIVGSLGEIIIRDNLNGVRLHEYNDKREMYNYDMIWNDKKYDAKTMFVYKKPQSFTDACTTAYWEQKPEGFVFAYIQNDYKKGWIAGHLSYDNFYKKSKFVKAGTIRNDGFKYEWDNHVCTISDLDDIPPKFTDVSCYCQGKSWETSKTFDVGQCDCNSVNYFHTHCLICGGME